MSHDAFHPMLPAITDETEYRQVSSDYVEVIEAAGREILRIDPEGVTALTAALLPPERPRYLMGVGMPNDLVESVARGIDLFDCVLPTRNARNGQLFTRTGPISIKNAAFAEDDEPVDAECACYTCTHFSRAYLRHLYMGKEITAATLNTLHNLHFYLDTMRRIRDAIKLGRFETFRQTFHQTYSRRR